MGLPGKTVKPPIEKRRQGVFVEGLKGKQEKARGQGGNQCRIGSRIGEPQQDDLPGLHSRQENFLLALRPGMDLAEHHHMLPPFPTATLSPRELRTEVGNPRRRGIEMGKGVVGKKSGEELDEAAFSRPRRAEENHGRPATLGNEAPKESLGTQKSLLPHKILQRGGAHPVREGDGPRPSLKEGASHPLTFCNERPKNFISTKKEKERRERKEKTKGEGDAKER